MPNKNLSEQNITSKFTLTHFKDERMVELVGKTDKKTLAAWAINCAERVMPYFENNCAILARFLNQLFR